MEILLVLLVPVVIVLAAVALRAWLARRPASIEAGIREFQRGLDALDPDQEQGRRRRSGDG